jgi:hypothetical protein
MTWPESLSSDNDHREHYLEITLDQKVLHVKKAVTRNNTLFWTQGLLLYVC